MFLFSQIGFGQLGDVFLVAVPTTIMALLVVAALALTGVTAYVEQIPQPVPNWQR